MPGLVPGIHVLLAAHQRKKNVDGRDIGEQSAGTASLRRRISIRSSGLRSLAKK
jgi:hypothetical protein